MKLISNLSLIWVETFRNKNNINIIKISWEKTFFPLFTCRKYFPHKFLNRGYRKSDLDREFFEDASKKFRIFLSIMHYQHHSIYPEHYQ